MIKRKLEQVIASHLYKGKAIILIGARQVGKTTLFESLNSTIDVKPLQLNCDDPIVRQTLTNPGTRELEMLVGANKIIEIDEAQRVEGIGMTLKRIIDRYPEVQLLITGSSSLGLRDNLNEPLTGRKFEYELYPISTGELLDTYNIIEVRQMLESRLIYGSYPDVIMNPGDAEEILSNLSDSYLYKDILELEAVRKPDVLRKLLIALAFQMGSEVSYNEVAGTIGSDVRTVERYIDLLEKCYVLYTLPGLSRNLRNELKKGKKIYFYDTGIRNAIINNFAPVGLRSDMGALWENFFIMERIKHNRYRGERCNYYFWRTTSQQEIDFVEERDGRYAVFEMKWNPRRGKSRFPGAFMEAYPVERAEIVTPDNYMEFLTAE